MNRPLGWAVGEDRLLVEVPEEQAAKAWILELRAGGASLRRIAAMITAEHFQICHARVDRVLKQETERAPHRRRWSSTVPDNGGPISPRQQRRFEAARRALEPLCAGRERRLHQVRHYHQTNIPPETVERGRWLLVAMGLVRGTTGGAAVAELARRGYVIARHPLFTAHAFDAVPLDHPGVIYLGEMLPGNGRRWLSIEREALGIDADSLPRLRFLTAHQALRIRAAVKAEGHDLGCEKIPPSAPPSPAN